MKERVGFKCTLEMKMYLQKVALQQSKPGQRVTESDVIRNLIEQAMQESQSKERLAA